MEHIKYLVLCIIFIEMQKMALYLSSSNISCKDLITSGISPRAVHYYYFYSLTSSSTGSSVNQSTNLSSILRLVFFSTPFSPGNGGYSKLEKRRDKIGAFNKHGASKI